MLETFNKPFLTLLDSRAKIKGSRDPLGFQVIWTALGRRIIKNLTTITTSPRNFTTLLLGFYFAERVIAKRNIDVNEFVNIFLKFEQISAYSRYAINKDTDFSDEEIRGILRVKRNLSGSNRILISADQDAQILSNQKTYGLWGLYTVAARNSGLLDHTGLGLNPEIAHFLETFYLSKLSDEGRKIMKLLEKPEFLFEPYGKDKELAKNLTKIYSPKLLNEEKEFYTKYLIKAGEGENLQSRLWTYIQEINLPGEFSFKEVEELIKMTNRKEDIDLRQNLLAIKYTEMVIAPLAIIFDYLMGNDQRELREVSSSIQKVLGKSFNNIQVSEFIDVMKSLSDSLTAESILNLSNLASALNNNDYELTLKELIERNKIVMNERGGNEWIKITKNKVDIRFQETSGELPDKNKFNNLWIHSYFINSLKIIGNRIQNS